MSKLLAFFGGAKFYLLAAGALIAAAFAAYWRIREDGKNDVRAEQQNRRVESMQQRKAIDDETDQMGAADVDSAYKRWLRDN